jgi:AcrR family transcriptional regulator
MSILKFATEIRREQIAQAALDLIATQGMKGFNVAQLARSVGVAPSAIYHHFKGKDEVLDSVLDLLETRVKGNVHAVLNKTRDPIEQLRQLLAAHAQLVLGYSALPRILFSEDIYGGSPERKTRLNAIIMNYLGELATIIREGQQRNVIRSDFDADTLAVMFLGLLQPTAILWHLSDGKFDAAKQVERAWPIFLESVRMRAKSEQSE